VQRIAGAGHRFVDRRLCNRLFQVRSFHELSPEQLKIDRAFVQELPENLDAAAIARGIVSMGSSLGVRVMAVSVENRYQADLPKNIWCEYAQGFFCGKPLPADAFSAWAKNSMVHATAATYNESRNSRLAA
jgi:EAL domain-containing protein (putative c-di-GMP-specific phosphodiesterase class I)